MDQPFSFGRERDCPPEPCHRTQELRDGGGLQVPWSFHRSSQHPESYPDELADFTRRAQSEIRFIFGVFTFHTIPVSTMVEIMEYLSICTSFYLYIYLS